MKTRLLVISLGSLLVLMTSDARAQSDNFNDGDDNGWTRYNPLAPFGAPGTFTFPAGGYRIQAAASPDPVALGPGRAGATRLDTSYANFVASVDIVNWDNALDQGFGITGRIGQVGLGTSDGYGLVYLNLTNELLLDRFDNENDTAIGTTIVALNPALDYRFVFRGTGSDFVGEVFALPNLTVPVATVTATDAAYASGSIGLLVASDGVPGTADATFDNFSAVPEPSAALTVLFASGLLTVRARRR